MNITKVLAWLLAIALLVLTLVPAAERPETGLQHDLEHLLAFSLAGLLVALAYPRHLLLLVAVAIGFTLALELMQIPLPTRHARVEDFAVDAIGACAAIVVVYLAKPLLRMR